MGQLRQEEETAALNRAQEIEQKARELAIQQVKRTSHTMDLEDQSVDMDWKKEQVEELSHELLRQSWKHLWEE